MLPRLSELRAAVAAAWESYHFHGCTDADRCGAAEVMRRHRTVPLAAYPPATRERVRLLRIRSKRLARRCPRGLRAFRELRLAIDRLDAAQSLRESRTPHAHGGLRVYRGRP